MQYSVTMNASLAGSYRRLSIARLCAIATVLTLAAGCGLGSDGDNGGRTGPPPTASGAATTASPTGTAARPEGEAKDVNDLEVGDCFDEPDGKLVEEVITYTCDVPHDAEVYEVPRLAQAGPYPGDSRVELLADQACSEASDAIDEAKLPGNAVIGYFFPTQDNWSADRNEAQCYVATDDEPLVGSVRRVPA